MTTNTSNSATLSEQAANRIISMILDEKRFSAGDKLPNEMELASELGISRVTLREAMKMLSVRGIVEVRRGCGTFVNDSATYAESNSDFSYSGKPASQRELIEIRMMLEPTCAYYAAIRATDEEIEHIFELCTEIETRAAENKNPLKCEQDFHMAIAAASHNSFMSEFAPVLFKSIHNDITLLKESIAYSVRDHREIVEAIADRSPETARIAMKMHILHVYKCNDMKFE